MLDVRSPAAPSRFHTFLRLLSFLHPYRVSLAVSIVLAAGSQICALAIPWLTRKVIDGALPRHDTRLLVALVAAVAGLGLAKALLLVGRRFIAGRQSLGVEYDLRNALYGHLLRL